MEDEAGEVWVMRCRSEKSLRVRSGSRLSWIGRVRVSAVGEIAGVGVEGLVIRDLREVRFVKLREGCEGQ